MHKSATKCNETLSKWCKNKHGASKIIDTMETYQGASWTYHYPYRGSGMTKTSRTGTFLHCFGHHLILGFPQVIRYWEALGVLLILYKEGRSQGRKTPSIPCHVPPYIAKTCLHQDPDLTIAKTSNLKEDREEPLPGARPLRCRRHHHLHHRGLFLLPHHGLLDGLYLGMNPLGVGICKWFVRCDVPILFIYLWLWLILWLCNGDYLCVRNACCLLIRIPATWP
jgi:hypothetical protein